MSWPIRGRRLAPVSTLGIVLVAVAGVLVLLIAGGFAGAMRRRRHHEPHYARRVAEADRALEHARAADKGWDRTALETTAREALAGQRPGWTFEELQLVLVDDRPGVVEDKAHFVASGADGEVRIILARRETGWSLEQVQ